MCRNRKDLMPEIYFKVGQKVADLTAIREGFEDKYGVITEVDGSNIEVKYESGNVRWKLSDSLKRI